MASGREDYWYGILPGKSILSDSQTPWFKWNKDRIAGNDAEDYTLYSVPANYRLHLSQGSIGCRRPGINRFIIFKDADVILDIIFDTMEHLPLSSAGVYIFEVGEVLKVRIYNYNLYEGDFHLTLSGFIEYLKL